MNENKMNRKGVALFMVLGTLLIVVILVNIILAIISSQARLTHHQVSRIQAYYAAMAGINLAIEKLRLGNDDLWLATPAGSPAYIRTLCQNNCDVNDDKLPFSVQRVNITVGPAESGLNNTRQISATAIYTYRP